MYYMSIATNLTVKDICSCSSSCVELIKSVTEQLSAVSDSRKIHTYHSLWFSISASLITAYELSLVRSITSQSNIPYAH